MQVAPVVVKVAATGQMFGAKQQAPHEEQRYKEAGYQGASRTR
jgi:hypothetical protein